MTASSAPCPTLAASACTVSRDVLSSEVENAEGGAAAAATPDWAPAVVAACDWLPAAAAACDWPADASLVALGQSVVGRAGGGYGRLTCLYTSAWGRHALNGNGFWTGFGVKGTGFRV
jgi:hypothetical protein